LSTTYGDVHVQQHLTYLFEDIRVVLLWKVPLFFLSILADKEALVLSIQGFGPAEVIVWSACFSRSKIKLSLPKALLKPYRTAIEWICFV
jgi:hypothetical protein